MAWMAQAACVEISRLRSPDRMKANTLSVRGIQEGEGVPLDRHNTGRGGCTTRQAQHRKGRVYH